MSLRISSHGRRSATPGRTPELQDMRAKPSRWPKISASSQWPLCRPAFDVSWLRASRRHRFPSKVSPTVHDRRMITAEMAMLWMGIVIVMTVSMATTVFPLASCATANGSTDSVQRPSQRSRAEGRAQPYLNFPCASQPQLGGRNSPRAPALQKGAALLRACP